MYQRPLLGIVIALAILGAIFWVLQRWWPGVPAQRRTRRQVITDVIYWFATPLLTNRIGRAAVGIALLPVLWLAGAHIDRAHLMHGFGPVAALPAWLQGVMVIVIGDFIGYWMHRAFHRGRLWPFHAVHHSAQELTWLSSTRVHPVNDALMRAMAALPFVVFGFSPLVVAAYAPFLTFLAIMTHANVRWDFGPLRYVIISPAFHRWHHADELAARDKNFAGLLPLWDWLFGTLYLPRGESPQRFGVRSEPIPDGWLGQMAYPFRRRRTISAWSSTSPT